MYGEGGNDPPERMQDVSEKGKVCERNLEIGHREYDKRITLRKPSFLATV
jgi:hypothetical protein